MQYPTLFDWAGGMDAFDRLTDAFYRRVHGDPLLAPVFAHVGAGHAHNVAVWLPRCSVDRPPTPTATAGTRPWCATTWG
jgi:hypothetical protein